MAFALTIKRLSALWPVAGLVLLALNLRAAITGVSPVLDHLRTVFGLSGLEVSVLTTLPVLCLGGFAWLAPPLARRVGLDTAVAGGLALVTGGVLLRSVPSPVALFAGTVLAGAGIAIGNVLVPVAVKRHFPDRTGVFTGLAMMLMAASGALAAAMAVPLDTVAGWRVALAAWATPAFLAVLTWALLAWRTRHERPRPLPAPSDTAHGSLLRSPLAWSVAAFLGTVSLMFYVLVAWLPAIMHDHGFPPAEAGVMVSAIQIISIPLGLAVPVAAGRLPDQRPLVVGVVATMAVGLTGILLAPRAGWLWIAILGLATGSAFPLAFTLLTLRAPNPQVAARLSGMAQTIGYLMAGIGPLAIGVLHDATGSWRPPLLLLTALILPEAAFGLLAARSGFVHVPARRPGPGPRPGWRRGLG
ncbi:CynX/NimT family MFS transporter [Streptomyces sp. NPDC101151]|uniref:CynX/NimT family MFS transporter n=1 Tax=Streptomyces sp. NPDC101151 TaxID=3366115 RepID=UPI0037FC0DB4